ncbi:SDR family oxidoreductase [Phreatobacter stygius]|uniref:SDR family oxidoreductase n=1 Tax=Phreatobacter stygius TaxID=1940610 RepID=A0A4D7AUE2_9HYPH|nr:SDR family oxidoreductase [Phreatobacter stygius]QCI63255.1 SDR family oxidoreductase [Phreatobacter stygius]
MPAILVTGANRGIGLALVEALLERGDRIAATARDPARADALLALAGRAPDRLSVIGLDVADPASVAGLAGRLAEAGLTRLDVLVNNAGIIGPSRQSTLDMDFDGFAETLAVNTLGPLRVVQAVLPLLKAGREARILTITSAMGSMSHTTSDRIAYRASKAAVNKVMQGLGTDLGPQGIAVAVAHPGWVRTDMGGQSAAVAPADSARGLIGLIDRMRQGEPCSFHDWSGRAVPW